MTRTIFLHYHLFKNAGTSVERMLKSAFGDNWMSYDKKEGGAKISANEICDLVQQHPTVSAFSSHQFVSPLPKGDFRVIPIVFFREPISRVKSAYLFEWQKQLGLEQPKGTLTEYILEKFKQKNSSVIANFQVSRLCNESESTTNVKLQRNQWEPLERAIEFAETLPFYGLVERFGESLDLINNSIKSEFPDLVFDEYHVNTTSASPKRPAEIIEGIRQEIGDDLFEQLCMRNYLDIQYYQYLAGKFDGMVEKRNP